MPSPHARPDLPEVDPPFSGPLTDQTLRVAQAQARYLARFIQQVIATLRPETPRAKPQPAMDDRPGEKG